ncbi:MAG: glycoside hydrolase family 28 protein [Blautia sp.]|nr:glycoside hydrolase family 28 protein [Blautia sp.]
MEICLIMKTARSASFEIDDGGIYHTKQKYRLLLNGVEYRTVQTVITSVFELEPDTEYTVQVLDLAGEEQCCTVFRTEEEFITINVRELGAAGDGIQDDTNFIQAAIMACPPKSRVLIPAGSYRITSLFLKSGLNLELAKGAELRAETDREKYVKFPGVIRSEKEHTEYHLGTWEGEPLPMFAGILTGIHISNATIYGEGAINGCANHENWWYNEKVMRGAYRPRMLFLNHCDHVRVQGLHFHDSPAWVIHPFFSQDLIFCNQYIENPQVSPNTDGIDPESCKNVEILGVHFSLGDDCIAVKSGKIYMGKTYKTPSENIHVYQCLMENGHGAVTVGSEIGAGVKNMLAEKCRFSHTDRGLRIKTRRGRGEDSVLDGITFRDIEMDHVMTPFTANAFYECDPDGKTHYVQCRDALPVDERTPYLGSFCFENIRAVNCHVAAAWFIGLPERKIRKLHLKNCRISFAKDAKAGVPVMAVGVKACTKKGIHAENVEQLFLENVRLEGQEGEPFETSQVEEIQCS